MSQPYVGEIRMFAGNFAIAGWAFCDGTLMPISEYETLFNLIGTTYGGDGQSTFALPDLRGRIPLHMGNGYVLAQMDGVETVTLTVSQIPNHSHGLNAANGGTAATTPANNAPDTVFKDYAHALTANTFLDNRTIAPSGGSQPHSNIMPYLSINFIISLFGVFPSQT